MILGRREILASNPPLVSRTIAYEPPMLEMIDPEQVQPNGVDLTVEKVEYFTAAGRIGSRNAGRVIPTGGKLPWVDGKVFLQPGAYKVFFSELITMPLDVGAIARPRSSLLRMGVTVETAVIDAGFVGHIEALLIVHNSYGFHLDSGARLIQLVFMRMESPVAEGYNGVYQEGKK